MTATFAAAIMSSMVYTWTLVRVECVDDEGVRIRPWEDHFIAAGFLGCIWVAAWVLSVIVEVMI